MPTIVAGKYEILRKIGQGGMGSVYMARHTILDTVRAVKTMPEHLAEDLDLVASFKREARVMAQLDHANIVKVFEIEMDAGRYYLVQEYVEGEDLGRYLKTRGALPLEEALDIVRQLA